VSEYSALRAGIFKASGSTDPMWFLWKAQKRGLCAPFIVSMSPPNYPSAWLLPSRASFRFARQHHCSSAAIPVFSTPSLPVTHPRSRHAGFRRCLPTVSPRVNICFSRKLAGALS